MISDKTLADLKKTLMRDEGMAFFPYKDTMGYLTIGVGRNLSTRGLVQSEIDFMLGNDIAYFQNALEKALPFFTSLDEVRQATLINMCFNLGVKNFLLFKNMLKAVELHAWDQAATQLLNSKYARQVGKRAQRLALQLKTGIMDTTGNVQIIRTPQKI